MKRLLQLILVFCMFNLVANAQSPRMVMIEEGTQASCPPCATENPIIDALIEANSDKVVTLKYQTSWPGFDQMNLDNPTEVADRIAYYGITGVPNAVTNGSIIPSCGNYEGQPSCLTQEDIDAMYAEMSPLTMEISAAYENGVLKVTGSITAAEALEGDLKLRMAVTEQHITIDQVPGGTNGETDYIHVMKGFIGGTAGFDLGNMEMGQVYMIDETMTFDFPVYDFGQLEVVAFVQDDNDKFVHQAAKDGTVDITVDFANNAAASDISGTPAFLCAGEQTISPSFKLVNGGNTELTSADIIYSANGGDAQTYSWTGSLGTLKSEVVQLDAITFEATTDATVLNVMVANPNGVMDELEDDNASSISIDAAPSSVNRVTVTVVTDQYADEIYWQISGSDGAIVASGGNPNVGIENVNTNTYPAPPHPDMYGNNQTFEHVVELGTDCYTFHITDYYGDGILGAGGYLLTSNDGTSLHSDVEDYQAEAIKDFGATMVVSIDETELNTGISIHPNPASDFLNVNFSINETADAQIQLMNAVGQIVYNQPYTIQSGDSSTQIDVSELANGVYFLNVKADGQMTSRKVTVMK